ncbi:MAG: peroxide stress protein YaaA [Bacteroidetes bacterium]|jgi:cytoplasmic iron level regulating protein YaaA (DUF328/UPF0246 family)|nr:peroxide stress protein YaaA [Bacteroidota bacterium]
MMVLLSPAKTLAERQHGFPPHITLPRDTKRSLALVKKLRAMTWNDLGKLLGISDNLAKLNHDRYLNWLPGTGDSQATPAMLTFMGHVYQGMEAWTFDNDDLDFAQQHVRILSGLYGLLRPLDLIMPYRLEMGTNLKVGRSHNLYEYWGDTIGQLLADDCALNGCGTVVNLASEEYFKAILTSEIAIPIIKPVFKDWHSGGYKVLGLFAKKARGQMAAYIVRHRIRDIEGLKSFTGDGYQYNPKLSSDTEWIFTRNK